MSLPIKRCTLQQVLDAQDWSEMWGRVQKHDGHGDALSTRMQGACAPRPRHLLNGLGGLAIVIPV